MNHSVDAGTRSATEFTRHGLAASYASKNGAANKATSAATDSTTSPGTYLQTRLPLAAATGASFDAACTGTVHESEANVTVLVAGTPYFREPKLTQLSNSEGAAAAIAKGYETLGEKVFSAIHGSFCCAILDPEKDTVLVAIDRLGQHSLYYCEDDGRLSFATCASATLALAGKQGELSNQGIYNYVYFHMVPCTEAVYTGLKKLQAAHYLKFSGGDCKVRNYWLPTFNESTTEATFEHLCSSLKDKLREAVKNTLPAEGKVGAFLSGGLDSSTVTGILSEVSDTQTQAYSIGFSAEGYDEMPFARITAKHFGVNLNEYYVTPQDVVDALPMIATSYDEPFGNSSALPAYFCARMAQRDGVHTLLAGDGGDEIFAGNERYDKQSVFENYKKVPEFVRRGLLEPLVGILPQGVPLATKAQSYITQANTPLPDRLQSYNFLHRHDAQEIFSDDFLADVRSEAPLELYREIYHRPEEATDLSRMLYLDWQITLADNDLRKVSHMCGLAGVDVTYPMLDDALIDFSCAIPSNWKIKQGDLRHFYKKALSNWLPHETIHKTKQGFGLPFGVWMQTYTPLREMAYDNLLKLKDRGFIQPRFIDKTIKMHQSEHAAYYGELVWIFTVFELWMSAHSNGESLAQGFTQPGES